MPTLEQALFERLMLQNPLDHLVTDPKSKYLHHSQSIETDAVRYLVSCYRRCGRVVSSKKKGEKIFQDLLNMKDLIVQNLVTAFKEPDFYDGQNLNEQLSDLILGSFDVDTDLLELLGSFAKKIKQEEKENPSLLENIFHPILDNIKKTIKSSTLILFSLNTIIPLQYFLSSPVLARLLVLHSFPRVRGTGRSYEDTVLGAVIEKSCLPGQEGGESWEYFSQPSSQPVSVHSATEGRLWAGLESVHSAGQTVIKHLLKVSEDCKHFVLLWLSHCLADNQGRGKMWTNQMGSLLAAGLAGDGFMLNLGSILLRLCGPMVDSPSKMDKVMASYPAKMTHVVEDKRLAQHHMENSTDTCLVSLAESDRDKREVLPVYNFPSEIFFMTHKCLDLGFRPVQVKHSLTLLIPHCLHCAGEVHQAEPGAWQTPVRLP